MWLFFVQFKPQITETDITVDTPPKKKPTRLAIGELIHNQLLGIASKWAKYFHMHSTSNSICYRSKI